MENLFKDFGRSFIVSSLLPASIFVILVVFLFKGVVPQVTKDNIRSLETLYGNLGIAFALLTLWFGFILYTIQDFVFKLFEGYYLKEILKTDFPFFEKIRYEKNLKQFFHYQKLNGDWHSPPFCEYFAMRGTKEEVTLFMDLSYFDREFFYKRFTLFELEFLTSRLDELLKLEQEEGCIKKEGCKIRRLKSEIAYYSSDKNVASVQMQKDNVKEGARGDLQRYVLETPCDQTDLLPTRFGNALRASERYPNDRYGLDGIAVFPRLIQVAPQSYINQLEEVNNKLVFWSILRLFLYC